MSKRTTAPQSHPFTVDPYDEFFFEGLGRQNLSFQHALGELVDNAIAASKLPFIVDIYLDRVDPESVVVKVSDRGCGISIKDLCERALKMGGPPISENRLNEHGWGLKNALTAFTGNRTKFLIQTRDADALEAGIFYEVTGPFKRNMKAAERPSRDWPEKDHNSSGTVVTVETTLAYFQGTQWVRGPKATHTPTLTGYLLEHLGVMYRGFLGTVIPGLGGRTQGQIRVHQDGDSHNVPALDVPMDRPKREEIPFSAGGKDFIAEYRHGVLDEGLRDARGFASYYQGNLPTQGIDVRIGGRTIATRQLDEIWRIDRHNRHNSFVGELVVPAEVPREYLRSINNKSTYDARDNIWADIFGKLASNYPPPKDPRSQTEREMRMALADNLRKYSGCEVVEQYAVWSTAVEVDIYQRNPATGDVTLYEVKTGQVQPINIYQLRMYWDGLVLADEEPSLGILVVAGYSDDHQHMVRRVNELLDPHGKPYKLEIKVHEDYNL